MHIENNIINMNSDENSILIHSNYLD
jgi:hypothetical protein